MPLKCSHEPIADTPSTALFTIFTKMCQNLKLVAIMQVDRSSLQRAAVLRLPLPSSDTLTRLVYNPNRETRKLKETRKGSMKWTLQYVVDRRVGEEKGLKLQVLGSIRSLD
jgi:hypothetical protein